MLLLLNQIYTVEFFTGIFLFQAPLIKFQDDTFPVSSLDLFIKDTWHKIELLCFIVIT